MNTGITYDRDINFIHGQGKQVTQRAIFRTGKSRPIGYMVLVEYMDRPELNFVETRPTLKAANSCFKCWKALCIPTRH